jgi:hypothetical protein
MAQPQWAKTLIAQSICTGQNAGARGALVPKGEGIEISEMMMGYVKNLS